MYIRIGKPAFAAILAAFLAIAAYWYWSPFLVMREMQSAARAKDADAFNAHVDYPRVRESLKAQLAAFMAEEMAKSSDSKNPFEALGTMLGMAMVDRLVDAMVRPETVMRGMQSGKFRPEPSASDVDGESEEASIPEWFYDRKGVDKLIAYPEEPAAPNDAGIGIVFERTGFATWKVTELRMPNLSASREAK